MNLRNLALLAATSLSWLATAAMVRSQPIVISEFMAKNDLTLEDEDGDSPDWIELCNIATSVIDLDGWSLTDDQDELDKWIFPPLLLEPGQSLIVFASNKDRTDPSQPLHTNFKLSTDGEYLGLIDPFGTIIHDYAPSFPVQQEDLSYGLIADIYNQTSIAPSSQARVLIPTSGNGLAGWQAADFDDGNWESGPTGIGYDTGDDFTPYIGLDIEESMYGLSTTALIRIDFEWMAEDLIGLPLKLSMQYDDGFACWLNGTPVAQANSPDLDELDWSSHAPETRDDEEAIIPEPYDLDSSSWALIEGTNTLAIQVLNDNITSPDLLMAPTLVSSQGSYLFEQTYLSRPTPGQLNIAEGIGIGPDFDAMEHEPPQPMAGEDITIRCEVEAEDSEVESVVLIIRRNFEAESLPIDMTLIEEDTWEVSISGGTSGEIIRWYAVATDTEGDTSRYPGHPDPFNSPRFAGVHVDDPVDTPLPLIRLFIEDTDAMDVPEVGTRGVVVHDGVLYDNVLVRPRGQTSLSWPKQSYKLDFNSGHHIPFLENGDPQEELNLQSNYSDKSTMRRQLSWDVYDWAGVRSSAALPTRLHLNGEFHSLATYSEQVDKRMLDRVGLDPEGAMYKMYNTCNNYWLKVEKKTREFENNQDLRTLTEGILEEDPELLRLFLMDTLDIPAVLSYLAATCLIHHNDHVSKNYYLYRDTEGDGEWQLLPWDKDMTFGRISIPDQGLLNDTITSSEDPQSHPLFGDQDHPKVTGKWNKLIDAIYRVPELQALYLRHLRSQMDLILQPPDTEVENRRIDNRIDELASTNTLEMSLDLKKWPYEWGLEQTHQQAIQILKSDYLQQRRIHLYHTHGELGDLIPPAQVETPDIKLGQILAQPSSGDSNEEFIELINNEPGPIDISGWRLAGDVSFTFASGSVIPGMGNAYVSPEIRTFRLRTNSPTGGEGHLVLGPFSGHVSADPCEEILLVDRDQNTIDSSCDGIIGDVTGDGIVGINDILQIISDWGCNGPCDSDANHDQTVDTDDILLIIQNWTV